jgi:co-chaperonin GroES (HSP10)
MRSRTLAESEDSKIPALIIPPGMNNLEPTTAKDDGGPFKIKPVHCLNDLVAIVQFKKDSPLEVPHKPDWLPEGIVVGVGPGLPTAGGTRCPVQLEIGDKVLIMDRQVLTALESDNGFYARRRVIIMSERNVLVKLDPIPFEIVDK